MKITNYTNLLELDTNRLTTIYKAKSIGQELDVQLTIIPATTLENIDTSFLPNSDNVSQWDHPYIAKLYDSGMTANNDYYLATEYFSQGSLDDKINHNALSIEESITILEQLVTGLDHLHKQGLIHYQLKPAAIKFHKNGDAVIADFALAELHYKITATTPPILLQDDLQYMCPEEAQTNQLTLRADIYKLALIAYEMLSGEAVCSAKTSTQALYQHAVSPPPKLPEKYIALQKVLNKGLAKKPEERHASAFHFLIALKVAAQKIGKSPSHTQQKQTKKVELATVQTQTSHHLKSGRPRLSADQAVSTRGEHELAYSYDNQPKTPRWRSKKNIGIAAALSLSLIGGGFYFLNNTKKQESVTNKDKNESEKLQSNKKPQDSKPNNQSSVVKKPLTTKISIHTLASHDKHPIKATFLLKLKNGNILGKAIKNVTSTSYDLFPATYQVIIKHQNTPEIIKTIIVNDKVQQIFINIETGAEIDEVKDTPLANNPDAPTKEAEAEVQVENTLTSIKKDEDIKRSQEDADASTSP
jgi:serine/threonine protein kinase